MRKLKPDKYDADIGHFVRNALEKQIEFLFGFDRWYFFLLFHLQFIFLFYYFQKNVIKLSNHKLKSLWFQFCFFFFLLSQLWSANDDVSLSFHYSFNNRINKNLFWKPVWIEAKKTFFLSRVFIFSLAVVARRMRLR